MKVYFNKKGSESFSELRIYSSLNPIPFDLKLKSLDILPETIYTRNIAGENFIEFRYDKETRQLYEITLVSVQQDTIQYIVTELDTNIEMYECLLDETSKLETTEPINILRSDNSLQFCWGRQMSKTFTITKECILGIDDEDNLCVLILTNLTKEIVFEILGF
jgi:hypothetical protein